MLQKLETGKKLMSISNSVCQKRINFEWII